MMRHHQTLTLGLALVFVLPTAVGEGQEPLDLQSRLEATIAAVEHLGGIEQRLTEGDHSALTELVAATEPAASDPQTRDATLARLRGEVSALQLTYDELGVEIPWVATPGTLPFHALPTEPSGPAGTHVGLDDGARMALTGIDPPRPRLDTAPLSPITGPETRSFEDDPEFSADTRREGLLLARLGRAAEALPLLDRHREDDPEVQYQIARCYENLGRLTEASELYAALVIAGQPKPEGEAQPTSLQKTFANRAEIDRRFLELRRSIGQQQTSSEDAQR